MVEAEPPVKKTKTGGGVVWVGLIGACVTVVREQLIGLDIITGSLIEPTKLAVPAVAMGLYVFFIWIWDALKPQNADAIRTRRLNKKAIAECEKQLKCEYLTDAGRLGLQEKRDQLALAMVGSHTNK